MTKNEYTIEVMRNVGKILANQGRSWNDLANHIGRSKSTVSRWIRGERLLNACYLQQIANELGVPISNLTPSSFTHDKEEKAL